MKKQSNKQKGLLSLSDIVLDIIKTRPETEINPSQFEDRKKYLVKVIHEKMKDFDLSDFFYEYENHTREVYNKEWEAFFKTFLDFYVFDGNTKTRKDIMKKEYTILNSQYEYKQTLFKNLFYAIAKGKEPELFFQKAKESKLYKYGLIFSAEQKISFNMNKFLENVSQIHSLDEKIKYLNSLQKEFKSVIKIIDDGPSTISFGMTFYFQKSELTSPLIMIDRLNEDQVSKVITAEIIRIDIQNTKDSYFRMLNETYEKEQNDRIMKRLFNLNESIVNFIESTNINSFTPKQLEPLELKNLESILKKQKDNKETPLVFL